MFEGSEGGVPTTGSEDGQRQQQRVRQQRDAANLGGQIGVAHIGSGPPESGEKNEGSHDSVSMAEKKVVRQHEGGG